MRGYKEGDLLIPSVVGWIDESFFEPKPECHQDMATYVYQYLNSDERPNALKERVLTIGDVIEVDDGTATKKYAAELTWWREV